MTRAPAAPSPCLRCGCDADAHQHLRDGTDCGTCGRAVCPSWLGPSPWFAVAATVVALAAVVYAAHGLWP